MNSGCILAPSVYSSLIRFMASRQAIPILERGRRLLQLALSPPCWFHDFSHQNALRRALSELKVFQVSPLQSKTANKTIKYLCLTFVVVYIGLKIYNVKKQNTQCIHTGKIVSYCESFKWSNKSTNQGSSVANHWRQNIQICWKVAQAHTVSLILLRYKSANVVGITISSTRVPVILWWLFI